MMKYVVNRKMCNVCFFFWDLELVYFCCAYRIESKRRTSLFGYSGLIITCACFFDKREKL